MASVINENWQKTIVEDQVSYSSNSQTKKIELPKSNAIGGIDIRLSATNLNDSNDANQVTEFLDMITKIRVTGNGSLPIVDLRPKELRAFAAPQLGHMPEQYLTHKDGESWGVDLPIYFGRYWHDRQYLLPAKLFSNLYLEIEYNLSDIADPGFDTGSMTAYVSVDEYVGNLPKEKFVIKRTEV